MFEWLNNINKINSMVLFESYGSDSKITTENKNSGEKFKLTNCTSLQDFIKQANCKNK